MSRFVIFLILSITVISCSSAQQAPQTVDETNIVITGQMRYIKEYRELAVEEMLYSGIPASVKLAQALLETQHGTSELSTIANNHFGIKCKVDWTGSEFYADDDTIGECFRKYPDVRSSYRDHSNFLKHNRLKFYDKLFELPIDDYKAWCNGLQECGYATAVTYSRSLIRIIERFSLYELDAYHLDSKRKIVNYKEVNESGDSVTVEPVKKSKITCVHIVRKGENLASIARIYDMRVDDLLVLNQFTKDTLLQIGQAVKLN